VAVLHGKGSKEKPILLLAHLDVVEARREDWTRDPFTLVEEGGPTAAAPPTTSRWPPSSPTC
jgi:acetylornithine deacetylase/succinyl-diaminopimelate desuccinylase-like protein